MRRKVRPRQASVRLKGRPMRKAKFTVIAGATAAFAVVLSPSGWVEAGPLSRSMSRARGRGRGRGRGRISRRQRRRRKPTSRRRRQCFAARLRRPRPIACRHLRKSSARYRRWSPRDSACGANRIAGHGVESFAGRDRRFWAAISVYGLIEKRRTLNATLRWPARG
jgi:hypothetical protein